MFLPLCNLPHQQRTLKVQPSLCLAQREREKNKKTNKKMENRHYQEKRKSGEQYVILKKFIRKQLPI